MTVAPSSHDRVLALHPDRSGGVRLRRDRYDAVRAGILAALASGDSLTVGALTEAVIGQVDPGLCTTSWYVRTVKLDLEARGILERLTHLRPHRVRLA